MKISTLIAFAYIVQTTHVVMHQNPLDHVKREYGIRNKRNRNALHLLVCWFLKYLSERIPHLSLYLSLSLTLQAFYLLTVHGCNESLAIYKAILTGVRTSRGGRFHTPG